MGGNMSGFWSNCCYEELGVLKLDKQTDLVLVSIKGSNPPVMMIKH